MTKIKYKSWRGNEDSQLIRMKKDGMSWQSISSLLSRSVDSCKHRYYRLEKSGIPEDSEEIPESYVDKEEEVIIRGDGSRTVHRLLLLNEAEKANPKTVMELMGFDPLQWELTSCKIVDKSWDVTMKMRRNYIRIVEGKEEVLKKDMASKHTNYAYAVTVSVKPIQDILTSETLRQVFEELNTRPKRKITYSTPAHPQTGYMLELPIMDFHLGKWASKEESNQTYSLEEAERIYMKVVMNIIERVIAYGFSFDKIIFPVGQDFFHIDTIKGTTTAGTQLEVDGTWSTIYQRGVNLLVWAIEQLSALAPVEVMYVAGNHDEMLSFCAVSTLHAYFRDQISVDVKVEIAPRKYVEYGSNLIGYSHGVKEGKRLQGLMQVEMPEAWGRTTHREWHLGHLHKEAVVEEGGIITRRVSAVTASDVWHNGRGFVGAIRKAQAFVWDKDLGNILMINSVVPITDN